MKAQTLPRILASFRRRVQHFLSAKARSTTSAKERRRLYRRANTALSDWKIAEAEEIAQSLLAEADRTLILAEIAYIKGDREAAIPLLRSIADGQITEASEYKLISELCGQDVADRAFQRSLDRLDALSEKQIVGAAFILFQQGRFGELSQLILDIRARETISKRLEDKLTYVEALACRIRGDDARVVELTDPASGISPSEKLFTLRAVSLLSLGRVSEAVEAYSLVGVHDGGESSFKPIRFYLAAWDGQPHRAISLYRSGPAAVGLREALGERFKTDVRSFSGAGDAFLFFADGGVGDEIRQAASYNEIENRLPGAIITCDPRLSTLLSRSFPALSFRPVTRWREEMRFGAYQNRERVDGGRFCAHICDNETWAIANGVAGVGLVSATLSSVWPNDCEFCNRRPPYLIPDDARVAEMRSRLAHLRSDGEILVGVSWRSTFLSVRRSPQYTNISDWNDVFTLDRCKFINLQPRLSDEERSAARDLGADLIEIKDLDLLDDFEGMAALIQSLDYVVAPSTTIYELAGAVGACGFFLSPGYKTEWRKMPDGSDIWHSRMQVVSPDRLGDKKNMIEKLARALQKAILEAPGRGRARLLESPLEKSPAAG